MKATFVLMAGLPGAGKTTLARALAERLRGAVLNKDEVRAALFPGSLTDYTREQDDLAMAAIYQAAAYLARHGRAPFLFLDGRTYSRREQVEQAIAAAEAAGCRWRILHLVCADEVARQRLERGGHVAANRDYALYLRLKRSFEPLERPALEVDTSEPDAGLVERCAAYLLGS